MPPSPAPAARLWRWAGHRLKDPVFQRQPEAHYDTAAFVDAVHAASKILRVIFPLASRVRHLLRGTPEMDGTEMLANWNTSGEFLDGAQAAHVALLGALWRPRGVTLPLELRDATSTEVRDWLEAIRKADNPFAAGGAKGHGAASPPPAAAGGAANGEAPGGHDLEPRLLAVAARFERLHGPPSLELIRNMDMASLRTLRADEKRMEAFHRDVWHGSTLQLQVASVAEAELVPAGGSPISVRRADRLHLTCDFNLREGIASHFRIQGVEELLEEASTKGFRDEGLEPE